MGQCGHALETSPFEGDGGRTMKISEILREAQERIRDPKNWTTGTFARNSNGSPLLASQLHRGMSWCALGSLRLTCERFSKTEYILASTFLGNGVPDINDRDGHQAIMKLYD